jgi:CPA1 family monovalent cation:H+ antiporter
VETVSLVLLLLLAVVASSAIARMLPVAIPAPLVQIALGGVIGLSTSARILIDPDLFFLLFLPPLLFLDGWRIPKDALFRDWKIVLELSLGLVVATVVGLGFLIHWMIPAMPLAVSFALAAVLSPTDPIAVGAIAARVPIPKRMMHLLEGESLFNDASGLVLLRFAIAAAVTGGFSPADAAIAFVWAAGGGLAIGVAITAAVTWTTSRLEARIGEEPAALILVSLLIPFGAYSAAEHLGCSGILAAVGAGVTMTFAEFTQAALPTTRVRRNTVWDTIQFAGNGIIFVLLGEQFPVILDSASRSVHDAGHHSAWWLLVYVAVLTVALAALRFAWVWASMRMTLLRNRSARPFRSGNVRLISAMSFAGVKGAITLAGILTLPYALADGTPFPARGLALFLAAGVILASLLIASVALPWLLAGLEMPGESGEREQEDAIRVALAHVAIRAVEDERRRIAGSEGGDAVHDRIANRIADIYRERVTVLDPDAGAGGQIGGARRERIARTFRLAAVHAQRAELHRLARARRVPSDILRRITRELDLLEVR